jgi:hypothetical protein
VDINDVLHDTSLDAQTAELGNGLPQDQKMPGCRR